MMQCLALKTFNVSISYIEILSSSCHYFKCSISADVQWLNLKTPSLTSSAGSSSLSLIELHGKWKKKKTQPGSTSSSYNISLWNNTGYLANLHLRLQEKSDNSQDIWRELFNLDNIKLLDYWNSMQKSNQIKKDPYGTKTTTDPLSQQGEDDICSYSGHLRRAG